jgi:hypothetical protein
MTKKPCDAGLFLGLLASHMASGIRVPAQYLRG